MGRILCQITALMELWSSWHRVVQTLTTKVNTGGSPSPGRTTRQSSRYRSNLDRMFDPVKKTENSPVGKVDFPFPSFRIARQSSHFVLVVSTKPKQSRFSLVCTANCEATNGNGSEFSRLLFTTRVNFSRQDKHG